MNNLLVSLSLLSGRSSSYSMEIYWVIFL